MWRRCNMLPQCNTRESLLKQNARRCDSLNSLPQAHLIHCFAGESEQDGTRISWL